MRHSSPFSSADECAVCLGKLDELHPSSIELGCGHAYHKKRYATWMKSQESEKPSCHVCKVPLSE